MKGSLKSSGYFPMIDIQMKPLSSNCLKGVGLTFLESPFVNDISLDWPLSLEPRF